MKKIITDYYLAHPFQSRTWVRAWELEVEEKLKINLVNPFYDIKRDDIKQINGGNRNPFSGDPTKVVNRDLETLCKQDGLIAMITEDISYGTIQEQVYAHLYGKYIMSLIMNGYEKHYWLRYHSDEIYTELYRLENRLEKILKEGV